MLLHFILTRETEDKIIFNLHSLQTILFRITLWYLARIFDTIFF